MRTICGENHPNLSVAPAPIEVTRVYETILNHHQTHEYALAYVAAISKTQHNTWHPVWVRSSFLGPDIGRCPYQSSMMEMRCQLPCDESHPGKGQSTYDIPSVRHMYFLDDSPSDAPKALRPLLHSPVVVRQCLLHVDI